jgi:hypothetical protein
MNKRPILYLVPAILGVLIVFGIYDFTSAIQNFYYHQKRPLNDFFSGVAFLLIFILISTIAIILQFILFRFLFRIDRFLKYLTIILGISILIFLSYYFLDSSFDNGISFSIGFFVYAIPNYFIYKKLTPLSTKKLRRY